MGKQIEHWGTFWLESAPDHRVPGHLTFHPRRHGHLMLHKPLREDDRTPLSASYARILGNVRGQSCALLNCFEDGQIWTSLAEPEINVRIFVNNLLMLPRQHAESPVDKFTSASASFDGLAEFDGRQVFDFESPNDGDAWARKIVAYDLEPRTVEADEGKLIITHGTGRKGNGSESESLTSVFGMRVEPRQPMTLNDLTSLFGRVRTFVAMAMHQDCRITGPVSLWPEPHPNDPDFSDDPYGRYVLDYEYHAVWPRGRRHQSAHYNRVLSFESMGAAGIARWLRLEDDCSHIISRLSSLRYARRVAYEDALLRVVAAADSFHRLHTGKQREDAVTMLTDLATYAGPYFLAHVPGVKKWATTIIDERHNAAHNKGKPAALPALSSQLVESVYWLVFICLLKRADAPKAALQMLQASQPFIWPMHAIFDEFGGRDWVLRFDGFPEARPERKRPRIINTEP